jgi:hypothetical protein
MREGFASDAGYFIFDPWPVWTFRVPGGLYIEQELFAVHGSPTVVLLWKLLGGSSASARLRIRPLLSGRDFHSTHHENGSFRFEATRRLETVTWHPYQGLPTMGARSNGHYFHEPLLVSQLSLRRARFVASVRIMMACSLVGDQAFN